MTPDKLDAAKKSWCGAAHSLSFLTLHVTSEISTSFLTSIELVSNTFSAKNYFWFSDKELKLDVIMHNHRNSKAIWNEARSRSIKVVCKFELITSLLPPYVECFPRPRSNLHLARKWQNIAGKSVRRKKTEKGWNSCKRQEGRKTRRRKKQFRGKVGIWSANYYHFGKAIIFQTLTSVTGQQPFYPAIPSSWRKREFVFYSFLLFSSSYLLILFISLEHLNKRLRRKWLWADSGLKKNPVATEKRIEQHF